MITWSNYSQNGNNMHSRLKLINVGQHKTHTIALNSIWNHVLPKLADKGCFKNTRNIIIYNMHFNLCIEKKRSTEN